jgi:translation initiation factor IF-3
VGLRKPKNDDERVPRKDEPRANERIRVPRVLVIADDGQKLGEFLTADAIALARERGLDLIEVSPNARPPVCKISDFGRLKYDRKKKEAAARKRQSIVNLKEVKMRPKTDIHDFMVKVRNTLRFLEAGDKVKVTLRFRGREVVHRDIGDAKCRKLAEEVAAVGIIEQAPRMDGRQMVMILAPSKK